MIYQSIDPVQHLLIPEHPQGEDLIVGPCVLHESDMIHVKTAVGTYLFRSDILIHKSG